MIIINYKIFYKKKYKLNSYIIYNFDIYNNINTKIRLFKLIKFNLFLSSILI